MKKIIKPGRSRTLDDLKAKRAAYSGSPRVKTATAHAALQAALLRAYRGEEAAVDEALAYSYPYLASLLRNKYSAVSDANYEDLVSEMVAGTIEVIQAWSPADPYTYGQQILHRLMTIGRTFTRRFEKIDKREYRSGYHELGTPAPDFAPSGSHTIDALRACRLTEKEQRLIALRFGIGGEKPVNLPNHLCAAMKITLRDYESLMESAMMKLRANLRPEDLAPEEEYEPPAKRGRKRTS